MFKVSVIIPVYNTSKYLVRCLESVRLQTLKEIEVIIVNDGSTDNSERICKEFLQYNNLNWVISTKRNGGLSSARRHGWELSVGKYIVFVDSDDELHPDYCKLMYEALEATDSELAICGYNQCTGQTKLKVLPSFKKPTIENIMVDYCKRMIFNLDEGTPLHGYLWMRMMRRDLISENCFINENKVFTEDNVFDLVYAESINRIVVVPKSLYNYYINSGSLTQKFRPNMLDMTVNLYQFYYDYFKSHELLDNELILKLAEHKADGVIAAIINAIKFRKLDYVVSIVQKVRSDKKNREPFEYLLANSRLSKKQKIWWLIIERGPVAILYLYYKLRSL